MITLALPNRGRLARGAERLTNAIGLNTERPARSLTCVCDDNEVRVVFVHHRDADMLVEGGYVDLAVTAEDILAEHSSTVNILAPLGIGACQIVLAIQDGAPIGDIFDLEGKTVATNYPNLARAWFAQRNMQVAIVALHGAIEVAPLIRVASGIVDSYETGTSARANGLRAIETLMYSQGVLIGKVTSSNRRPLIHLSDLFSEAAHRFSESL